MNIDFDALQSLSGSSSSSIELAIQLAHQKQRQYQGKFLVCPIAGNVLVLPELSASLRKDIEEVIYDTDSGYVFSSNNRSLK